MATVIVKKGGAAAAVSSRRARERRWLLAVTVVVACGLLLLGFKQAREFGDVRARLGGGEIVNLNALERTNQEALTDLFADVYEDPADRAFLAARIAEQVQEQGGVPNVGALNGLVTAEEIAEDGGARYQERLAATNEQFGLTPTVVARETRAEPPTYPSQQPERDGLTIAGRVDDPEGEPLAGVLVALQGSGPADTLATAESGRADTLRTDGNGRFVFTGLEAGGTYAVRPVRPGMAFTTRMLEGLSANRDITFRGRVYRLSLFDTFGLFQRLKERFVVRTPGDYLLHFALLSLLFISVFWVIHLFWTRRQFGGDGLLLPIVMSLTGLSLLLMFGLPDPLRDRFLAQEVVIGTVIGGIVLAWISQIDVQRWGYQAAYGDAKSFIWVGLAALLSVALLLFGTGPTGSEGAKVNLVLGPLTVQPVEVIKACLLVFFAGYFARNWEFLRNLEERNMPGWLRRVGLSVPRLRFVLPVMLGVVLAIGFFILQRDLGPALVICTTFLLLYGIVRRRWLVVALGFAALVGSFWLVYEYELVPTVVSRVAMMLSPWDNTAGGGEHLAQAIWSLTTGGFTGQGLGDGHTLVVPAAHTDMVMAIVGEELGLLGFLGVLLLYAVLFHRGLLVALRSGSLFGFFLGAGIVISSALQLGLIVGGMLGVVPLSGVVSPLLSYGKSALIMHLLFIGVLLNLSARDVTAEQMKLQRTRFAGPVGAVGVGVLVMLVLLGLRTAYIQVIKVDDWIVKPALVPQADGRRGFAYNPRVRLALDRIRLGTLYDRNGIPLATSDPSVLTDSLMDVDLAAFQRDEQERIYPFGPLTYYLLGDYNQTGGGWGDVQGLYAERRFLSQLRGYDNRPDREQGTNYAFELPDPDDPDATYTVSYYDYRELVPYLRAGLDSRKAQQFFEAKRDHRLSIDIRLQERVAEAIRAEVGRRPEFRDRFISAAVIDVHTGEVLAAVTYPLPENIDVNADEEQLYDHALYANKPPGSTFKLATAMAAFREMGNEAADWETSVSPGTRFIRIGGPTGRVSMALAIENSSNVYFSRLAEQAGAEEMLNVMDAIGVRNGFEDASRQEEVEALTRYTNLQQAGFGQGLVIASPLAVARMASIPANEGRLASTRWLVAHDSLTASDLDSLAQQVITPEQARILAQYMRNVVIGPRGTGRRLSTLSVPVAGKTGTAEQDLFESGRNLGRVTHAWFTGYAPYTEQPTHERQIAVAVLVESGKEDLARDNLSGGRDAGPIAGAIFEAAADLGLIRRMAAPDSIAPPDSTAVLPDSTVVPPDSSVAPPDSSIVSDSTNVALHD